jgi:hypothetical protein
VEEKMVKFLHWVFVGFEKPKGETYTFEEVAVISARRGAGVGVIIFIILLFFFPLLTSFAWAFMAFMMLSIFGLAAAD